jgi:AcrR family transcriptional regulator
MCSTSAEQAGANKRLIYVCYGNNQQLFDAVIARNIQELTEAALHP